MSSSITLKAVGLNISPNSLDVPPGSLTTASNVIIKRDSVIESRRGYKLYGNSFASSTDRAKQLLVYQNRILRHYTNKLDFDTNTQDSNGVEIFNTFAGTYLEPLAGRRIRGIESNGNFYFTSSNGIQKISALVGSQLSISSGFITLAGGIKALDLETRLNVTLGDQSSWFEQDSTVAYRVLWSTKDANNNLIQGTPSQRSVIYNPMINLLLQDFNRLLGALDDVSNSGSSLISDANYVSSLGLDITSSSTELYNNLLSLTTKIDEDILFADDVAVAPLQIASAAIAGTIATITFSSGDPTDYLVSGDKIFLDGFVVGTSGEIDGEQTVASVTSTTLTFNTTATGSVSTTGATIVDDNYRSIQQPTAPSTPTTHNELQSLQDYIQEIITTLQGENSFIISTASQTAFVEPLDITTTATVILDITIPDGVTTDYFFQIYRSAQFKATGTTVLTDLVPNDELQLVYEAFPTSAEITAQVIEVEDITPDSFRGAFLYTNEATGEGILQSNDTPPFALDINRFKNVTFYANTRTKQRLLLNLLGVQGMIDEFNAGRTPTIVLTDGVNTNTFTFVTGLPEITDITTDTAATLVSTAAPASYFTLNSANDFREYYVWYKLGSSTDPAISGKIGIEVLVDISDTAADVALKTRDVLNRHNADFYASNVSDVLTVENIDAGITTDATAGTSGFSISVTQQGRGQDVSNNQVLLSTLASPAQAVTETALSLVQVINQTLGGTYAFYLSGPSDVPGQILLEGRSLSDGVFYLLANNAVVGASFNPDLSPAITISSISVANPTVITTSSPHGLIDADQIVIDATDSTPSADGLYTITYIDPTSFSIDLNVTVAGTTGVLKLASSSAFSENEQKSNRIYYSKFQQPEAVPILNYFDVGAQDQEILRIFPLKDSLFVFKTDGLFRISGEQAPFNLALFDSSCILIAADSLDVSNNLLYGWTTQGISSVSEGTVSIVSRPIDTEILRLATDQFTNFDTATWGIGYESDNSYTVYTVTETTDTLATIAYRYSTLTNTWTNFDKTATCGVIKVIEGKQYLGAGDTDYLEQERKDFTRYDYADRELPFTLALHNYQGTQIQLSTVAGIEVGDVLVQDQQLSMFEFNTLLSKLDIDANLSPHTYVTNNTMSAGQDLRTSLDALLEQIANDSGRTSIASFTPVAEYEALQSISGSQSITANQAGTPTVITATGHGLETGRIVLISASNSTPVIDGTYSVTVIDANTFSIPVTVSIAGTAGTFSVQNNDFRDIQTSYNLMIDLMNDDVGFSFHNYLPNITNTIMETIVVAVNKLSKTLTVNLAIDYLVGPLTIFKAITTEVVWAPQTMGDPLGLKHVRESTLMFQNKAFTTATMSFATDLLPMFNDIEFPGDGNGIFGYSGNTKGFGSNFFGGGSNSIPFRTYIPRDCQRCRFLVCKFEHSIAREMYSIYGVTITAEVGQSSRAYR